MVFFVWRDFLPFLQFAKYSFMDFPNTKDYIEDKICLIHGLLLYSEWYLYPVKPWKFDKDKCCLLLNQHNSYTLNVFV